MMVRVMRMPCLVASVRGVVVSEPNIRGMVRIRDMIIRFRVRSSHIASVTI